MDNLEYTQALNWLKIVDPENVLLPELEAGPSYENIIYLTAELKNHKYQGPGQGAKFVKYERTADTSANDDIKGLLLRRSNLYGARAKLSNLFHTCTSNAERSALSKEISDIQSQIEKNYLQEEFFKRSGVLSVNPGPSTIYPVPDDTGARQLLLNSLRSSISRFKKLISEETDPERRTELQTKLNNKKIHRAYVERAIKN